MVNLNVWTPRPAATAKRKNPWPSLQRIEPRKMDCSTVVAPVSRPHSRRHISSRARGWQRSGRSRRIGLAMQTGIEAMSRPTGSASEKRGGAIGNNTRKRGASMAGSTEQSIVKSSENENGAGGPTTPRLIGCALFGGACDNGRVRAAPVSNNFATASLFTEADAGSVQVSFSRSITSSHWLVAAVIGPRTCARSVPGAMR